MRGRSRDGFRFVAVAAVCLVAFRLFQLLSTTDRFAFDTSRLYRVERVVDGDTLLLEGGTRIRLLGVNTPETKHPDRPPEPFGFEAAAFTRRHTEGRYVKLRFDRERRDRYHRVLAYVYLDDWFLNEELIRAGYSRAETRFPYSGTMKNRFRQAEEQARTERRGRWAK
jgi:micrococcal nuclease